MLYLILDLFASNLFRQLNIVLRSIIFYEADVAYD